MKALKSGQIITFLFRKRPREGEIIDYERNGNNSRYRVTTVFGDYWIKRKQIIESEELYNERVFIAKDTGAIFEMTLE